MELYLVFNSVLIFLVVCVLFFIFRFVFNIKALNKKGAQQLKALEAKLKNENKKLKMNTEKVLIIDELNQTLFSSILKISRDFILLQKLIFDKKP
ncbi:hypothetical protein GCM10023315_05090 [Algibacter aquimarinus]|uniref:Histidine kinase n=1 Tax=Algibacter aquimarinus TaxID=1136748 RepID=A0ABP9H2P3_9FLAO